MSQPEQTTAGDPVQEELVAYLDGELDNDARVAVERRLAEDADYRVELMRLEKAWDLLDELPQTQVDPSFTQSTVEMVAVAAAEEVDHARTAGQRRRLWHWIGGGSLVALAAVIGFLTVSAFTSRDNDALARDLQVIENVEVYRHIDSIEFLRQLEAEGLFEDEEVDDAI